MSTISQSPFTRQNEEPLTGLGTSYHASNHTTYQTEEKVTEIWNRQWPCSVRFSNQGLACTHSHPKNLDEFFPSDHLQLQHCITSLVRTIQEFKPNSEISQQLTQILKKDFDLIDQLGIRMSPGLTKVCHQLSERGLQEPSKQSFSSEEIQEKKKRKVDLAALNAIKQSSPLLKKWRSSHKATIVADYSITIKFNGRSKAGSLALKDNQILISTHNHGEFSHGKLSRLDTPYLKDLADKIEKCKTKLEKEALKYELAQEIVDYLIQPDVDLLQQIDLILRERGWIRSINDSSQANKMSLSCLLNAG